jgi:hypothetical protein
MSASLLAEQMAGFVTLAEAEAQRSRLARAVAGGDPARFDRAEITRELEALLAAREGSPPPPCRRRSSRPSPAIP